MSLKSPPAKISIIVPIYNVEAYLHQCVDSLLAQTYDNIEIILVDDGSPDNCPAICDEYAERDSRITVIHKSNDGPSGARNSGMERATGEYVMFVDGDDWIDLETCALAIKASKDNNAEIVFWSYIREFNSASLPKDVLADCHIFSSNAVKCSLLKRIIGLSGEDLRHPENADSLVTVWGKLYMKKILEELRFVNTKQIGTSEDALFNLHAFIKIEKAVYLHRHLYHYRKDNQSSLTSRNKPLLFQQWGQLYKLMCDFIADHQLDASFAQALNNRIALSIIGLGLNECAARKGHRQRICAIKTILGTQEYRTAIRQLPLHYFPLHWRLFFSFARVNCASGLYLLCLVIKKMIEMKNEV